MPSISFESCPLMWWKASNMPILFRLACHHLVIQATSVASERIFSSTGNILSSSRNRLTDEKLDMLTFLYINNK